MGFLYFLESIVAISFEILYLQALLFFLYCLPQNKQFLRRYFMYFSY